jgi:hypothetical protein
MRSYVPDEYHSSDSGARSFQPLDDIGDRMLGWDSNNQMNMIVPAIYRIHKHIVLSSFAHQIWIEARLNRWRDQMLTISSLPISDDSTIARTAFYAS